MCSEKFVVNGNLEHLEELVETDKNTPGDKRTMDNIKEVANNICTELEVTYDVESNYSDIMVPILDMKVRINENNKIAYHFYQKPMKNKSVITKTSAFSHQETND